MQMIERIALGALTLWILHMGAQATSQMVGVFREESRSAHERRYRKEYALKCKVRLACWTLLRNCWKLAMAAGMWPEVCPCGFDMSH